MNPERFRLLVSAVLIVGVSIAAALIAAGLFGSFLVGWHGSLLAAPIGPSSGGATLADLLLLRPVALAQAGIVVLVLTPVARVVASVVAFWLEGDRLYVAITLAVLAILLGSLFLLH